MFNLNKKIRINSLLLLIGITFVSCSDNTTNSVAKFKFALGIVSITDEMTYQLYSSQTYKEGFVFDSVGSTKHAFALDTFKNATGFFNLPSNGSAGSVGLSGTALTNYSGTYSNDANPDVAPNGHFKKWIVAGSGGIPTITDSVAGPTTQIAISSPANAANISKSNSLTVTWSPLGDSNEVVAIELGNERDSGTTYFETVANTGSYTISSTTMGSFKNGRTTLVVRRGNYKIGTASNSKKYILLSWTQAERDINITN